MTLGVARFTSYNVGDNECHNEFNLTFFAWVTFLMMNFHMNNDNAK